MSDIAIRVEGLSKRYRIRQGTRPRYETLYDAVANFGARIANFGSRRRLPNPQSPISNPNSDEYIWALKDVSFEVKRGEVVGIIGRNGAGKSTLLKVLSRITEPTEGYAEVRGRVGSLLEVGTGFHPELTGRENIYLNGAILGMKKAEIDRKFDEIVAFAEIEKFIDTPVKFYSSGMYVRLAFAVATHLDPEILLVDEVLAVGDAAFQKKCLGKMGEVAGEGRTVLFVSHNMAAVQGLCGSALLIDAGQICMKGESSAVVREYLVGSRQLRNEYYSDNQSEAAAGSLLSVRILDTEMKPVSHVPIDDAFFLEIVYRINKPGMVANLSVSVFTEDGIYVFATPSLSDARWSLKPHPPGVFRSLCLIPANLLNRGRYDFTVLLVKRGRQVVCQLDRIVSVEMVDTGRTSGSYYGFWGGVVRPLLKWTTDYLGEGHHAQANA